MNKIPKKPPKNEAAQKPSNSTHPLDLTGVPLRVSRVIGCFHTKKQASQKAGVSSEQMARYVKGQNAPPFEVAARLCHAAGVSLDWLATGTAAAGRALEEPDLPIDISVLAGVMAAVEISLSHAGTALSAGDRAWLIARSYADAVRKGQDTTGRSNSAPASL